MIECRIDGEQVTLRNEALSMPTYSADKLHSVEAWRQGSEQIIEVVSTPESDRIMNFAFDLNRGVSFNDSLHRATLEVDGVVVYDGVVTLLGVESVSGERYYRLRLRSGGSEWAEKVACTQLKDSDIELKARLSPTDIEASWQGESTVRFLPLRHDSYPKPELSNSWLRQRVLMPHDYHPFIGVEPLIRSMAKSAGYSVDSRWLESDVVRRLMISGAYKQLRGEAAERDMGFKAYRTYNYTAEANSAGYVFATEPKLPSHVGAIVDSISNEALDESGNPFSDAYNNGALRFDAGQPMFSPTRDVSVAFEYKIRYTTDYRIVSSKRLVGFDHVRLGGGCDIEIALENTFEDVRSQLEPNIAYKLFIFDYDETCSYMLDGIGEVSAAVSDIVVTDSSTSVARLFIKRSGDKYYTRYSGDWAIYRGYVDVTGKIDVEFTICSPYLRMTQFSEERFSDIAFYGAEPGQKITLRSGCSVRPLFSGCLGYGNMVTFEDIANHNISQQRVLEAIAQMFNLCFYVHEPSKSLIIEPYDDFFVDNVVDWSSRQVGNSWSVVEGVPTSFEQIRLEYLAGDGVVVRDNELSDSEFGVWLKRFNGYGTKQGVDVRSNPLFRPTLSVSGFLNEAFSAEVLTVGDRDSVDGGDYVEPRVVLYHGLKELPKGEHWSSMQNTQLYPYAAFHSALCGETLCFEDRDGCEGLHRYYDNELSERAERCQIRCNIHISLPEYVELFNPWSESASIRSTFMLEIDGAKSLFKLQGIDDYDYEQGVATCRFSRRLIDN